MIEAIIDNGRIRAIDTPERLRRLVPQRKEEPSLEEVFTEVTDKSREEGEEQGATILVAPIY